MPDNKSRNVQVYFCVMALGLVTHVHPLAAQTAKTPSAANSTPTARATAPTPADTSKTSLAIDAMLHPASLSSRAESQLIISIASAEAFSGSLQLTVPPLVQSIQPIPISILTPGTLQLIVPLKLNAINQAVSGVIVVEASNKDGARVAGKSLTISVTPLIDFSSFVTWGAIGVALGFLAKYLIELMKWASSETPAQTATAGPGGSPKPSPDQLFFARKYYWLFDFMVTLILGVSALVLSAKGNLPPDLASSPWHAMVFGAALGLLSNSQLISRLPAK
jgi:hypothetical protein